MFYPERDKLRLDEFDGDDAMSAAKARLKVEFERTATKDGILAYGLKAKVVEAEEIPPEVFVYHRSVRQLATGFPWDMKAYDMFQNVATPVDIEETVTESEADANTKYFRSDSMDLVFRCQHDVDRAKATIEEDLKALVRDWRRLDDGSSYEKETKEYVQ